MYEKIITEIFTTKIDIEGCIEADYTIDEVVKNCIENKFDQYNK